MIFTRTTQKITTLTTMYHGHKFFVDITENEKGRESWIYTDKVGIKELMFESLKVNNETYEEYLELVESNFAEYADGYEKEYC